MLSMLIVDDSDIERDGISYLCKLFALPLRLFEASDGEQALGVLRREAIDILFTDIKMPHMDGLQLCAAARGLYPELYIIVCSAYGEFEYAQKALSCKASSYLLRPVHMEEFHETLRSVIVQCEQERLLAEQMANRLDPRGGSDELFTPLIRMTRHRFMTPAQKSTLVESVQRVVRQDYSKDLRVGDIAREVHLSEGHLCRAFKREAGVSLMQYLLMYRLERARDMLLNTEEKISDIARDTGFQSSTYFGMVFKREMGMPPNDYRENQRANGKPPHESDQLV